MISALRARMRGVFAKDPRRGEPLSTPRSNLGPPNPPLAKRLNRNALTVAAVLMGMTVIASLMVLNTGSPKQSTQTAVPDRAVAQPSEPTFLQHPVPRQSNESRVGADTPLPTSLAKQLAQSRKVYPSGDDGRVGIELRTQRRGEEAGVSQAREQAFKAALIRPAIARNESDHSEPSEGRESPAVAPRSTSLAAEEEHLVAYGDSLLRGTVPKATATEGAPASAASMSPRRRFLEQSGDAGGKTVLAHVEPASSPFVLQAGTVIPAILLTAITSDLPGDCMGQVTRDVFDSRTQRILLIPKGSKLMCRYDDQIAAGQGRLLVAWTRLLLPDGRGMTLPGLALKDAQGQTGAKGDVDNHTRRVFGRALLLSAIGAGAQLSQPRQGSILAAPTTGQVAAGAVGQELSNVALEVLRRGMEQPPTITVQQGQTFNVFLNGDLVFDGPYIATP